VSLSKFGPPLVFQGALTVGGTAAARGILGLSGASLRGSLGGRSQRNRGFGKREVVVENDSCKRLILIDLAHGFIDNGEHIELTSFAGLQRVASRVAPAGGDVARERVQRVPITAMLRIAELVAAMAYARVVAALWQTSFSWYAFLAIWSLLDFSFSLTRLAVGSAAELMAERERPRQWLGPMALEDVLIGAAHAAGADLDQRGFARHVRPWNAADHGRRTRPVESRDADCGGHYCPQARNASSKARSPGVPFSSARMARRPLL